MNKTDKYIQCSIVRNEEKLARSGSLSATPTCNHFAGPVLRDCISVGCSSTCSSRSYQTDMLSLVLWLVIVPGNVSKLDLIRAVDLSHDHVFYHAVEFFLATETSGKFLVPQSFPLTALSLSLQPRAVSVRVPCGW